MKTENQNTPIILPDGLEVKTHGSATIPFAVYRGNIPEYIPSYPLHYHDELELIYCMDGIGKILIDGEAHLLFPGDFACILPQQVHSIDSASEPFSYCNLLFRFSLLETPSPENPAYQKYFAPFADGTLCIPPILKKDTLAGKELKAAILPLLNTDETPSLLRIKSRLYAAMEIFYQTATPAPAKSNAAHKAGLLLRSVIRYIDEHYAQPIHIAQAAAYCGYSDSHFMRLFSELTGTSFSQYLIRFRLEKAAGLLRTSRLSVLEIALSCGFPNASYFTRTFQRQYHVTPSRYRKDGAQ